MPASFQEFFTELPGKIDPKKTAGMNATFQFVATGDAPAEYYVQIANGETTVAAGKAEKATIVLTATNADWMAIMNKQMNGQTAFLTGKLKIQGDVTLAMKLESLFNLG